MVPGIGKAEQRAISAPDAQKHIQSITVFCTTWHWACWPWPLP